MNFYELIFGNNLNFEFFVFYLENDWLCKFSCFVGWFDICYKVGGMVICIVLFLFDEYFLINYYCVFGNCVYGGIMDVFFFMGYYN